MYDKMYIIGKELRSIACLAMCCMCLCIIDASACDGFLYVPHNDGSGEQFKRIYNVTDVYTSLFHCIKRRKCLSVSFDSDTNTAYLYTSWNDGKGGQYQRKNRCPRQTGMRYSGKADLCFKVFMSSLTWDAARAYCMERNGDLVKLDTQHKVEALYEGGYPSYRYFPVGYDFWVGGTYDGESYSWLNGVEVFLNNSVWHAAGYPTGIPSKSKLAVDSNSSPGLFDESPEQTYYFICEF